MFKFKEFLLPLPALRVSSLTKFWSFACLYGCFVLFAVVVRGFCLVGFFLLLQEYQMILD